MSLSVCKICESTVHQQKPPSVILHTCPSHEVASPLCSLQSAVCRQHPAARYWCLVERRKHTTICPVHLDLQAIVASPILIVCCPFFLFIFHLPFFPHRRARRDRQALAPSRCPSSSPGALPCHQLLPASVQSSSNHCALAQHSTRLSFGAQPVDRQRINPPRARPLRPSKPLPSAPPPPAPCHNLNLRTPQFPPS